MNGVTAHREERPTPRVSIGLPVYNGENYVRAALDGLLGQTFRDVEVIVCDNASTDQTESICREYAARDARVWYQRNPRNIGAVPNYNLTLQFARGEFFKWAAHDDVCDPRYVERCVELLEQQPKAVLAFSKLTYIDGSGNEVERSERDLSIPDVLPSARVWRLVRLAKREDHIYWSIFGLARTEAMRRACPMGLYIASDQIVLMRLLLQGTFVEAPEYLFHRRQHAEASTVKQRTIRELAQWYAGGKPPGRIVLPTWKLYSEYIRAVRDAGLSMGERMKCRAAVVRRFVGKKHFIWRDVKSIPVQLFGGDVPA